MELQIIRANEFIRLGTKGKPDVKASKQALAELVGACRKRGINRAMLDLRELAIPKPKPAFSRDDLVSIVNTFHEIGFTPEQRLAVLYASDPHHRVRLFSFIAKLRGWNVLAFDNFEKAFNWLSQAKESTLEIEPEVIFMPVKITACKPGDLPNSKKATLHSTVPIKLNPINKGTQK